MKSGYFLKEEHWIQCEKTGKISKETFIEENTLNGKNEFIIDCNGDLDNYIIYDRKLFKTKFLNIYNKNKFSFSINQNLSSNIIIKWKNTSLRFTKQSILFNYKDFNNKLILRDYSIVTIEPLDKIRLNSHENAIWVN